LSATPPAKLLLWSDVWQNSFPPSARAQSWNTHFPHAKE
jgi:hypothetical protein